MENKKRKALYTAWANMKQRCNNKKNPRYKDWGGRGITYTLEWKTFEGFVNDMGHDYELGLSIDRINNDEGYFRENCRWISLSEQTKNRRGRCHKITDKMSENQLNMYHTAIKNYGRKTIAARICRGWSVEEACMTPINKYLLHPKIQIWKTGTSLTTADN